MKAWFAVLAFGAVTLHTPAFAQTAAVPAVQCDYHGGVARPGDRFGSTSLVVPRDGRCTHYVAGRNGNVRVVNQPGHGRLDVAGSALTYTPNAGYTGADQYVFVTDLRVQVTVSVNVR
jgi:hypothetical protein